MAVHLVVASVPLLAISAHVFGVLDMRTATGYVLAPLVILSIAIVLSTSHRSDRVLGVGLIWGVIACAVYDFFRLDTSYLLNFWGDFIPTMGGWVTHHPSNRAGDALVGYVWRYVGDGGGIGSVFFAVAGAVGARHWRRRTIIAFAMTFAVVPVWSGLIATVAVAPAGQQLLFPLTFGTVALSLIGHLIFGYVLGIGLWRSRAVLRHWPWPPLRFERLISSWPTWRKHAIE